VTRSSTDVSTTTDAEDHKRRCEGAVTQNNIDEHILEECGHERWFLCVVRHGRRRRSCFVKLCAVWMRKRVYVCSIVGMKKAKLLREVVCSVDAKEGFKLILERGILI